MTSEVALIHYIELWKVGTYEDQENAKIFSYTKTNFQWGSNPGQAKPFLVHLLDLSFLVSSKNGRQALKGHLSVSTSSQS